MPVVRYAKSAALLAAIFSCPLHAQAQEESGSASGHDAKHSELSEIVVTAQRRAQNLQDVPVSVSAISGDQLADSGIRNGQDLLGHIAALSASSAGVGRQNLAIRGISTQAGLPVVGVYLDDVPLLQSGAHGQTSAIDPDFFDLNRIEVLRGPQGTLYGASSLGGTLRYITNQPSTTAFSAKVASDAYITQHGALSDTFDTMVNIPMGDRLAARIVASYSATGGYVDRLVGDFSGPGRAPVGGVQTIRNVNDGERAAIRGLLRYDATGFLHITAGFFGQKMREASLSAYDAPPGASAMAHLTALNVGDPYRDNFTLPSLTIEAEVGPVQITNTTAYLRRTGSFAEDQTEATREFVINPLRDAGVPLPDTTFPAPYFQTADKRQFTEELRISSADQQSIHWVAGTFYQHEVDLRNDYYFIPGFYQQYGNPSQVLDLFGAPVTADNNFYSSDQHETLVQAAVFADVTVPLTSQLEGTVGLRKFWYHSSFNYYALGTTNGPAFNSTGTAAENGVQPRAVLSYRPAQEKLIYASYAKGFRPGAGNSPPPVSVCGENSAPGQYQSDTVSNYEVGAKTRWFERRVQLNVAAYHLIWDRIQQSVSLPCGYGYTVNAGVAESNGGELEYQLALPHGFSLDGAVAYIDSRIKSSSVSPDYVGKPPQSVAPWTGSLNLEYGFALPADLAGYVRVGSTYVGRSYADFTRDDPTKILGNYFLTNLRMGVSHDAWNAALFVDNVADRHAAVSWYFTNGYQASSFARVLTNRPRTIGISLEYQIK